MNKSTILEGEDAVQVSNHKGDFLNDQFGIIGAFPGKGGANTGYFVVGPRGLSIKFQDGDPHKEVNGVTNEILLAIVIDRLQGMQDGPFACDENAYALTNLENALRELKVRTETRAKRGVLGQAVK